MPETLFDAIPADHRETARSAVAAAFGAAPLATLQPVAGGASGALIYRLEVGERPYLLRVETARDIFRNPSRSYACMRIAAEAGVAPPLRHADPTAGVAIMDFLPNRPLDAYPGGPEGLVRDLGRLMARLQATPVFPPLGDYLLVLNGMFGHLRDSGPFAAGLLGPHQVGFERIRQAYPWDAAALVSSHNDPNPRNILFDGERLWLVDWELSFRNDPLADLAIIANELCPTPALETALLEAWLGRTPDRLLRARLLLMRQLTRLFYACLMLTAGGGRGAPETDLSALSEAEFRAGLREGRIKAGAPETLHILGKMVLAGFLAGLCAPGFEEALATVRQG